MPLVTVGEAARHEASLEEVVAVDHLDRAETVARIPKIGETRANVVALPKYVDNALTPNK